MSKVHFLIGHTSTEALNTDQTALVILPETISPAAVPTYSGQLYEGVKVLLKLGSEKNIFTTHFLPYLGYGRRLMNLVVTCQNGPAFL